MSYTNPYGQPQGLPYYFTNKIREAMIGEIVAMNGYAEHISNSVMPVINEVWQHILKDEKEHFGMFMQLLQKYDPTEKEEYYSHLKDSYKVEAMQTYKPEIDRQLILNNIREDLKGELEAVILYEQLIIEMPFQDIKDTFHHIIREEKEHAEHLTRLLISLDTDKYNGLK